MPLHPSSPFSDALSMMLAPPVFANSEYADDASSCFPTIFAENNGPMP
jgi:hypothetical protein